MRKHLKRRYFIRNISAAVIGGVTLGACVNNQNDESDKLTNKLVKTTSADRIAENQKMPRDLVMKLLDQKVNNYMQISYNCAQSSFLALKEQFGLKGEGVLKALTPLTGIAERGETCGAVIGPLMAFGLLYGRGENKLDDWDTYRESLIPSGKFCKLFEKEYGSTMCHDIQNEKFGRCYHLTKPDELKKFQEDDATTHCSAVVRKGVQIAANIILDGGKEGMLE